MFPPDPSYSTDRGDLTNPETPTNPSIPSTPAPAATPDATPDAMPDATPDATPIPSPSTPAPTSTYAPTAIPVPMPTPAPAPIATTPPAYMPPNPPAYTPAYPPAPTYPPVAGAPVQPPSAPDMAGMAGGYAPAPSYPPAPSYTPYQRTAPAMSQPFALSPLPSQPMSPTQPPMNPLDAMRRRLESEAQPVVLPSPPPRGSGWRMALVTLVALLVIMLVSAGTPIALASASRLAYPKPQVSITTDAGATVHIGDTVNFTANVLAGRDLTFNWVISSSSGDQPSTGKNVSYVLQDSGQVSVTLTATDPIGQSGSANTTLNALFQPPHASFTYSRFGYYCEIAFDGSSSTSQDPNLSYQWDFGDNYGTSSSQSPSYQYSQSGTYTVTLTVTDSDNQTDSTQQQVTLTVAGDGCYQ